MADFRPKKAEKKEFAGRGYPIEALGGRALPSVTNVIDVMSKPMLVPWAAKKERELVIGVAADIFDEGGSFDTRAKYIEALTKALGLEKAHSRFMSGAADIGTAVHARIERTLREELGLPVPNPKKISLDEVQKASAKQAYLAFLDWRARTKFKPKLIEKKVWSLEDGFAGTMDVLGEGNLESEFIYTDAAVGDWKTSAGIYMSACIQVSAYRKAYIEMGLHDPMNAGIKLNGLILRLPKNPEDPGFEARFIPEAEMLQYYVAFRAAKALWDAVQEYDRKHPYRKKKKSKTSPS